MYIIYYLSATTRIRRHSFRSAGHVAAGHPPEPVSVDQQRSGNEHGPAKLFNVHDCHRSLDCWRSDRSDQRRNNPHATDLHESRIFAAPVGFPLCRYPRGHKQEIFK